MSPVVFLCIVLFLTIVEARENLSRGDEVENEDRDNKAFESFDSPVYGVSGIPKSGVVPGTPKSGYSTSIPSPLTGLPASYSAYLNALGYGSPYGYGSMYNRFGLMPYTLPYYGYGAYGSASMNDLGYGYGSGLVPGYGAGLPYINPYLGRAAYNTLGYGGFPYGGLGYRFGGLGYNGAAFRGAPVAAPPPPPVPAVPAPVPAVPAPAYRQQVLPVQGKDGSFRPAYSPVGGARLPVY